jgi:hypothetical protein
LPTFSLNPKTAKYTLNAFAAFATFSDKFACFQVQSRRQPSGPSTPFAANCPPSVQTRKQPSM